MGTLVPVLFRRRESEAFTLFLFLSNLGIIMQKLLNAYRANPTPANHARLQAYINKHPFAVCLAPEETQFLKAHNFTI